MDALVVNRKTLSIAGLVLVPVAVALFAERAWLLSAVPVALALMLGCYFIVMARRFHVALAVIGVGFVAWAGYLVRYAISLYPN
jgi:hypothetical protein